MLDANLGETSRALSHWGVGVGKLLGKSPMDPPKLQVVENSDVKIFGGTG